MKIKVSIIILLIFGISGIPSIMKTSASTLSMQQFDKSTMIKKKLADAQAEYDLFVKMTYYIDQYLICP